MSGSLRAQVIAYYDYIKSEMPDVFFTQNDPNYPINFAANPYPVPRDRSTTDSRRTRLTSCPWGTSIQGSPLYGDGVEAAAAFTRRPANTV